MNNLYFSIVIPLYNKEKHIARTIQSVLDQTWPYFEIVVVNDGSTDKSVEVVKNFNDERLRIIHQPNSGVSVARNKGIEAAKYNWVAFLDGDDEWKAEFLKNVVDLINFYPKVNVFATGYEYFNVIEKGVSKPNLQSVPEIGKHGVLENYFKSVYLGAPVITSSSSCFNKKILIDKGGFPDNIKRGEDLDLWFRIALSYPIVFLNKSLVIYNVGIQDSATKTLLSRNNIYPYHKWKKRQTKSNPYIKKYIKKRILVAAKNLFLSDNYIDSIITLLTILK